MAGSRARWWPQTLFARILSILIAGLVLSHVLTISLVLYERFSASGEMMLTYLESDVASSVALLDRLPAAERPAWLPRLSRRYYHFSLEPGMGGPGPEGTAKKVGDSIKEAIGQTFPVEVFMVGEGRLQAQLRLSDGNPLTIHLKPSSGMPLSPWLPVLLSAQLAVLMLCSWGAVRLATRPLAQLAQAADLLGPDLKASPLPETGPTEVAHAASAFNAMQARIAADVAERMQILAAVSHDLQTPITRMRLRADLMDDEQQRDKMQRDLLEMEALVREGVSFARTSQAGVEPQVKVELDALLESLTADYTDAGQAVTLDGRSEASIATRPRALRRVLCNLIDNALKFAGAAEIEVRRSGEGKIAIAVLDRGPGIPPEEMEAVFQPFYRVETSRSRETGGTGLGLAIARQLAQALGASLTLSAREGGGLAVLLTL